jgi:hypothetical protein
MGVKLIAVGKKPHALGIALGTLLQDGIEVFQLHVGNKGFLFLVEFGGWFAHFFLLIRRCRDDMNFSVLNLSDYIPRGSRQSITPAPLRSILNS